MQKIKIKKIQVWLLNLATNQRDKIQTKDRQAEWVCVRVHAYVAKEAGEQNNTMRYPKDFVSFLVPTGLSLCCSS